jgi:hypothetical protein
LWSYDPTASRGLPGWTCNRDLYRLIRNIIGLSGIRGYENNEERARGDACRAQNTKGNKMCSIKNRYYCSGLLLIIFFILTTTAISENICGEYDFLHCGARFEIGSYRIEFDTEYAIYDWMAVPETLKIGMLLKIKSGEKDLIVGDNCDAEIYNYCYDRQDTSKHCFLLDINKDGKKEIMIDEFTGGAHCCHIIAIYGLDSAATKIFDYDGEHSHLYVSDIDNDSLYELVSTDCSFAYWQTCYAESPRPGLIWRWDNGKYRLANYYYSDYLLKEHKGENGIRELAYLQGTINTAKNNIKEYKYNWNYTEFPPAALWGVMLDYIYAGKSDVADSIFNALWPIEISGKEKFYRDFRGVLEHGPYWKVLQESGKW